jgi:putative ABC transport system permease protein
VREVARQVAPDLPLLDVMTVADAHAAQWRPLRAYAAIISSVGGIALILAAIGLYGIVAYTAQRRTREIGIRIALGAMRGDVIRLVTRQGMTLVGLGIAFGLVGATLVTPVMRGLLFGARPFNPGVYAAAALLLLVVAVIATYLPAHRAAATDPMVALRND